VARLVSRVERVVVHREGDDLLGAASWGVGACQTDQIVAQEIVAQEIVAVGFGRVKVWRTTLLVGHATPHEAHGSQRNLHLLGQPKTLLARGGTWSGAAAAAARLPGPRPATRRCQPTQRISQPTQRLVWHCHGRPLPQPQNVAPSGFTIQPSIR
jgi:hypothetical protein